ncbi:unnamed protein product [Tuber aestivum]|uniref:F-box domain-containing protein n=1 Tax=Tuber aestivum TaxID=59557 RepID=A0A292PJZ8_9PEZI|nr:unnamed protein product [Tuber aestivum]
MSFLNLPNELILKTANDLNPSDLCSLLKSSHRLAALLYFPLIDSVCRKCPKIYATKALYLAARGRNKQVVQDLLDRGILENVQNRDTLLNYAVGRRSEAMVQTLLECGVSAETRDRYGRTPLTNAADRGYEEIAQILIDHGVDVNSRDNSGCTPLHIAALGGHEEMARMLLQARGIDINARDKFSEAPSKAGPCIAWPLLQSSRVLNLRGTFGWTPLFSAIRTNSASVVRLLLDDDRIDPNALDERSRGPIYLAARIGNEEILKCFLAHKKLDIDPGPPDNAGPLHIAVAKGIIVSVRLLLGTGRININRKSSRGKTPLHHATKNGYHEIVQLLLAQKDVNIDIADYKGRSVRSSISTYPPKVCEILTEYVSSSHRNAAESAPLPEQRNLEAVTDRLVVDGDTNSVKEPELGGMTQTIQ